MDLYIYSKYIHRRLHGGMVNTGVWSIPRFEYKPQEIKKKKNAQFQTPNAREYKNKNLVTQEVYTILYVLHNPPA
jgi:hypothetical protein